MRTSFLLMALLLSPLAACDEGPPPLPPVDAASTPEAQREQLAEEMARAEAAGNWPRAEAAAAGLARIEPEERAHSERLRGIRARRAVHDELTAIEALLEEGAWRTCQGRLQVLLAGSLHEDDRRAALALVQLVEERRAQTP